MTEPGDRARERTLLARALRLLQSTTELTQDDWAKAAGVRPGTISYYLQGRLVPSLRTLQKLMAALGYRLSVVERAQVFLLDLGRPEAQADRPLELARFGPAALEREIESLALERGRLETRWSRLQLLLLAGRKPDLLDDSAEAEGEVDEEDDSNGP